MMKAGGEFVDQLGDFTGDEGLSFDAVVEGAEAVIDGGMVAVQEQADFLEGEAGAVAEEPGEDLAGEDDRGLAGFGFEDGDGGVAAEADEEEGLGEEIELGGGHKTERSEERRDFRLEIGDFKGWLRGD
jgi:hypothetical protein